MAKADVAQTGFALVNGKERPIRLLADGTQQWNDRNNPAKGKWTTVEASDDVTWTSGDGRVFEVEQPPVADDPEYLETEMEQIEADAAAAERADVDAQPVEGENEHEGDDDAPTDAQVAEANAAFGDWPFLVSARGAKGIALLFAGTTPDTKVPYLGFTTMADVHQFLGTNLRSAWALSTRGDGVMRRRGVHLLLVHANDAARTVVHEYDPRPANEDDRVGVTPDA